MEKEKVWLDEREKEVTVYSEEDLQDEFRKKFPEGLTVTVRDESVENLRHYMTLDGYDDDFIGYVGAGIQMLKVYGDLNAELRLPVEKYNWLYADDQTWWSSELSDMGYESGTNAATEMMEELDGDLNEARLAIPCHPEMLQHLYIEGVPFKDVKEIIQNHDIQKDTELREILALQNLYKNGLPKGGDVPEILKPYMTDVEEDMQHMFGGQKPFREHEYYEQDIFHKFSRELQLKAEVMLMQRGLLPTEKHNIVVQFCNNKGDNWEAAWMLDHYRRNNSRDCDVEQVGDRLVFSVTALDAKKQVDLRHGLECSWAQKGVHRMPFERIADSKVYMATQGGPVLTGYVGCNQFTENNYRMTMNGADGSSEWKTVHAVGGNKHESLQTAEKVDFGKDSSVGIALLVAAEKVDKNMQRVTDVNIYAGQGYNMFIRCKIDGVQQTARKLNADTGRLVTMVNHRDGEFQLSGMERLKPLLAVQYFGKELEQEVEREADRGVRR